MTFHITATAAQEILAAAAAQRRRRAWPCAWQRGPTPDGDRLRHGLRRAPRRTTTSTVVDGLTVVVGAPSRRWLEDTVLDYVEIEPGRHDFIFVRLPRSAGTGSPTAPHGRREQRAAMAAAAAAATERRPPSTIGTAMNSFADVPAMIAACGAAHGKVYLVGAGPGDPELLTLRAARLLAQAAGRRLRPPGRAGGAGPGASRGAAHLRRQGTQPSHHGAGRHQHAAGAAGARRPSVVRLKGGDPFIFGRGGEELQVLAGHGVPFEVVPGITAACGVASYAGIPLTHRDYAQSCLFVTGHLKDGSCNLDWPALARPRQTVAIYMGLAVLPTLCERLVAHGLPPDWPAAVVEQGTLPSSAWSPPPWPTWRRRSRAAGLKSPCLTIVGEVVRAARSAGLVRSRRCPIAGPRTCHAPA